MGQAGRTETEAALQSPAIFFARARFGLVLANGNVLINRRIPCDGLRQEAAERPFCKELPGLRARLRKRDGRITPDGVAASGAQKNDEGFCAAGTNTHTKVLE